MSRRGRALATGAAAIAMAALWAATLAAQVARPGWDFSGTLDGSYVSATGNSEITTVSVGHKVVAARASWTLRQTFAYVYGRTDGTESANQARAGLRTEYAVTGRFSAFAAVVYERNAFAGFDRRFDEQLGAQWRAVAAARDTLTLDAGGVITQQENRDGTVSHSPSARGAATYRHRIGERSFLGQFVEYVPNLRESGAYRLNAESSAVAPLSARIALKLSYVIQYNSAPPAGFGTTDRVFTSGVQVSY